MLKTTQGYRTILFNVGVAVATALWGDDVAKTITQLNIDLDVAEKALVALWAAANVALRAVTTTPVLTKPAA